MLFLSVQPEYIRKFVRFLRDATWHIDLSDIINNFLESKQSDNEIDNLIMSITKKVETTLRESIEKIQGRSLPSRINGIKLLDYALDCKLIDNKDNSLYHLIYWLLKEPRNKSHHEFTAFPYNALVQFTLDADATIRGIKTRIDASYSGSFTLSFDPSNKVIQVQDVKIWRPDQTSLPSDQKVEGILRFQNGTMKTLPLSHDGQNSWKAEYDARGEPAGTLWVNLGGENHGKHFLATNTSAAFISPQIGEACPNCGKKIGFQVSTCPNCGYRLRV